MRYYFDIRDDHYTAEDQEGTELGGNEDGLAGSYQDRDDDCGRRLCCGGSAVTVTVRDSTEPIFAISMSMTSTHFTSD